MSLNEHNPLSVEEVEKALKEIENKYSPITPNKTDDAVTVLSREFDSLGLPPIDSSQSLSKIFKQVVSSARSLVQIHRTTLSRMKDVNIDNKYKELKSTELHRLTEEYKLKLNKCEERNLSLQSKILKLSRDNAEVMKRESMLKEEMEKTKRFYLSKQNELQHHLNKLTKENVQLKQMLGKDINVHNSKDDVVLKLIKQYKGDEEIYKSTIKKLQENNAELLNEILDLKEENAIILKDDKKVQLNS